MNLRILGTHVVTAPVLLLSLSSVVAAQPSNVQTNSATRVSAELTKGKLSPAASKPGDMVAVRLKEDLRSNGHVVLKKGSLIEGVVRNVKQAEPKTHAQSMVDVEWVLPPAAAKTAQSLSIALQSVIQVNPIHRNDQDDSLPDEFAMPVGRPLRAMTNPALLSMPSVVAVDHQTTTAIETNLDSPASGPLFNIGHGELVNALGTHESVDLFSHLSNDTVIASPSRDFEITSGAQMQLLVGVIR
ncbi:MAG TPA: hypothetical protein VKY31_09210 [Terriglobia bacterium]|nr:hypothetical protein [Terriglobia bacterium]